MLNVVKLGGSLARVGGLPHLSDQLSAAGRRHPILVVPGGGDFADLVRAYDQRYQLTDSTAHWMAILAMDQYGYLLAHTIPGSAMVREPSQIHEVVKKGRVAVLLPFQLLHTRDPLPHRWTVTSDSIAAWVAAHLCAHRLILLKDVDGLYTSDPKRNPEAHLLPAVSLDRLRACGGVDGYVRSVLEGRDLEAWVINGTRPERLGHLLNHDRTRGTRITP